MAYATVEDIQSRMTRSLTDEEQDVCSALLEDADILIDSCNYLAADDAKRAVACRMVIRSLASGDYSGIPAGATQGSMSGLGYSQSWTISSGSVGELYLSKTDRKMLGAGNRIGSRSPVENMIAEAST